MVRNCLRVYNVFLLSAKINPVFTYAAIQATALTFDPEVFDREDVLHLWYVGPAVKLFLAPVPLVDNGPL